MAVQIEAQAADSPYRWIACPQYKRNLLRLAPDGLRVVCKGCGQLHFYSYDEILAMRDELKCEQTQAQTTEVQH